MGDEETWGGPAFPQSYTTFTPLLPEAVGASIFPAQVVAPLREILRPGPGRRFVMGHVTAIDTQARTLVCNTLAGTQVPAWDHLVLAVGNRARLDLLPGMAEHALPLKMVGDALAIRNAVLRRVARIELETDAGLRRALGHVVVVGGGFSGVEVAGELVDCLRGIRRWYPGVAPDGLQVSVLHDGDRLLPELPPALGQAAMASLRARGVAVRLQTRATALTAEAVLLESGEVLASHTVICTIGNRPNPLVAALGLPSERGRIAVAADLSVPGHAGLWALGDCACVPNAGQDQPAPPTAQFAVRQGSLLADNLLATLSGQTTRPFAHVSLGAMASIGHMKGVAQVFGWSVSGLPAWLLWRAYYLSQMPTLRRRVRLFVEWTWGMLFPTDITHLRFDSSRQVQDSERPAAAGPGTLPDKA